MKTGKYDVVAEINEASIDMVLGALYYKGFLDINGSYKLPIGDIPDSLKRFTKIDYKIKLKDGPTVDFIRINDVRILISGEVVFNILDGIELEFEIDFSIESSITYNQITRKLFIDLKNAKISDIDINNEYDLPSDILKKFNEIISIAISRHLTDEKATIDITPTLYSLELPEMPPGDANKLKINMGNVKILNSKVIAACFNLLDYSGGNVSEVIDFTDGNDFAIGICEDGMHRVFDFWWARTTHPKSITKTDKYDVPVIDDFLDFIADVSDVAVTLATAGIVVQDIDVDEIWIDYGATVKFGKPSFNLKSGNKIELDCDLKIDVWASAKAKITKDVDYLWGIIDKPEETSNIVLFSLSSNDISVSLDKATGKVYLDDQNRLMGKLEDIEVTIDLGSAWYTDLPEDILNSIILPWIKKLILDNMPPIVLSPAFISQEIPGTGWTLEVDINKLEIFETESFIKADVGIAELKRYCMPVPRYIANKNPESREVHRSDCLWVEEMNEENKIGYYILYDALEDGYDGCKYCLPKYHRR